MRASVGRTRISLAADVRGLFAAAHVPGPYVLAGHSVGGTYALAFAMDYPEGRSGRGVDRLGHPVSVRSAELSGLLLAMASWPGAVADARPRGYPAYLRLGHGQFPALGCESSGARVQRVAARATSRSR